MPPPEGAVLVYHKAKVLGYDRHGVEVQPHVDNSEAEDFADFEQSDRFGLRVSMDSGEEEPVVQMLDWAVAFTFQSATPPYVPPTDPRSLWRKGLAYGDMQA